MKPTLAKEIILDAILMAICSRKSMYSIVIHFYHDSHYSGDQW
jgi:putative transposase